MARCLERVPGYPGDAAARAMTGFRDEAVFQHDLEGPRKAG